jgi:hypothetical protein
MKPSGYKRLHLFLPVAAAVRSIIMPIRSLGATAGAWLGLAIRFWLGKAFLIGAVVSMAMHLPMTMSFGGVAASAVDRLIASPVGAVIATLCPTLLMIGLSSRTAALLLLFEACALQGPEGPSPLHLYWAVLLGWIIIRGPGPISIDALLSRDLVSTAVPGIAELVRVTAEATRILEPWYRLALRLWIVTAPLAGARSPWALIQAQRATGSAMARELSAAGCQAPSWNENMKCLLDLAINSENIGRPCSHY